MFTIYNNGSVGFRSTADNLYTLENVDKLAGTRLKPDYGIIHDYSSKEDKDQPNSPKKKAIDAYKKMANMDTSEQVYHVQEIMTLDVISINKGSTLQDAYDLLKEKKVSQIPVIDFGNKIVSMINKKFILNLLVDDIKYAEQTMKKRIEALELPDIITTDPISDIRRVSKVMIDFKLDAIPVVDEDDILKGMVSKTDIIKAVSHIPHFQLWA